MDYGWRKMQRLNRPLYFSSISVKSYCPYLYIAFRSVVSLTNCRCAVQPDCPLGCGLAPSGPTCSGASVLPVDKDCRALHTHHLLTPPQSVLLRAGLHSWGWMARWGGWVLLHILSSTALVRQDSGHRMVSFLVIKL